jgi:hypothetical protein
VYGLDLRESLRTLPAVDLVALVNDLDGHWGPHEENTALLLEAQHYALELAWADRTVDPNDREVIRARREAERAGIKPPPHPLIPPIANRPPEVAELRLQQYVEQVAAHQTPAAEKTMVSLDEFDATLS